MKKLRLTGLTEKLLSDNPEFTFKWIEGLRSGKYTQIRQVMFHPEIPNSACCLQVMEECCNELDRDITIQRAEDLGVSLHLPTCLYLVDKRPLVLRESEPENDICAIFYDELGPLENEEYTPVEWNDELKLTFYQIADLLEKGEVILED
jgi:hypothetical protein